MSEIKSPRLQLRWEEATEKNRGDHSEWVQWLCHYELIVPLREYDIRRDVYEDGEVIATKSELTVAMNPPTGRCSQRVPCRADNGELFYDDPIRDGPHAIWDAQLLGNLPIYVVSTTGNYIEIPESRLEKAREASNA